MRRDAQKKNGSLAAVAAALFFVTVTAAHASVEISSDTTKNISCSAGVCSPTAKKAVLNVTDLTNMLATEDVKITTGAGAVTITVFSPFSWTSTHRLTLDAYETVSFRAPVTVAGTGAVTITYNDGGTGGDLIFFPGAKLDFWDTNSNLNINGDGYTLIKTLHYLAKAIRANPSGSYALVKDYNAAKDGTYTKSPIKTFNGTFEGLGHAVSNLSVDFELPHRRNADAGMFSSSTGTLRDILLVHANIISPVTGVGALVGVNGGTVMHSNSTGTVSGDVAGGLVGGSFGTLIDCSSASAVTGGYRAGGLVGENLGGKIFQSFATGQTSSDAGGLAAVGGLVGANDNEGNPGLIVGSYSTETVAAGYQVRAGGLAGMNWGTISLSHSDSAITSISRSPALAGGLVGWNLGLISQSFADGSVAPVYPAAMTGGLAAQGGTVLDSYATGKVAGGGTSDGYVGGLVGNTASITQAYSTGSVSTQSGAPAGGLVGLDSQPGDVGFGYWDLDTSGISNVHQGAGSPPDDPGIMGLTDQQLKSGLPAGFDPNIWGQKKSINNGYPYLIANPPPQ